VRRAAETRAALVGALCATGFVLGAALPEAGVPDGGATLRTESERVILPWVGRDDLMAAAATPTGGSQRTSISLDVAPPRVDRGWELTVRAAAVAGPAAGTRPPQIYWKLDSEPSSDFRALGNEAQRVRRSTSSTSEKVTIDVVFGIDWAVGPGRYDVDFQFALEPL
jgi:hypothetical protein